MLELSLQLFDEWTELFGTAALIVHLIAYSIYAREVFHERIRPNISSWLMWLFGGVVELATYNAISGSSWSTNALPFGCVLGIGAITFVIGIAQIRNYIARTKYSYHAATRIDYALVSFDMAAAVYWLLGGSAVWANIFAVSTSFISFIPIIRTTYRDPAGEHHLPWILWSIAYGLMFLAVVTGPSSESLGLYFFPLYYFLLHAGVAVLSKRI